MLECGGAKVVEVPHLFAELICTGIMFEPFLP